MSRNQSFYLWHDREIKFDIDKYDLAERPGERVLGLGSRWTQKNCRVL